MNLSPEQAHHLLVLLYALIAIGVLLLIAAIMLLRRLYGVFLALDRWADNDADDRALIYMRESSHEAFRKGERVRVWNAPDAHADLLLVQFNMRTHVLTTTGRDRYVQRKNNQTMH